MLFAAMECERTARSMIECGDLTMMEETYRAALALWGAEAQTLMMFEEMAELQKELCKNARGKDNREEIAEEIADVRIMLDQMEILHNCKELSRQYKVEKLLRLQDRIEGAQKEVQMSDQKDTGRNVRRSIDLV